MYKVQFTLESNNKPITIYFSNNITVIPESGSVYTGTRVIELSYTGGWLVSESYEEVLKQIDSVLNKG